MLARRERRTRGKGASDAAHPHALLVEGLLSRAGKDVKTTAACYQPLWLAAAAVYVAAIRFCYAAAMRHGRERASTASTKQQSR